MTNESPAAAWGLHVAPDAARLARVQREGSIWRVTDEQTFAGLADVKLPRNAREPLAVCLDDDATLLRRLDLPQADNAATARMVQAQLETMLPGGGAQLFTSEWARSNGAGGVWVAAMRTDRLRAARQAAAQVQSPGAAIIPQAAALAACAHAYTTNTDAHLIVRVGAHQTLVVRIEDGHLAGCATLEGGADDVHQRAWLADLRDTVKTACGDTTIKHCLLLGGDATLADAMRYTLHMDIQPLTAGDGALAVGAAASRLAPSLAFKGSADKPQKTAVTGRWRVPGRAAAALILIGLIAAIVVMDLREAERLQAAVAAAQPDEGLTARLALARHLDSLGPPPIAVLEDVSRVADKGVILKRWQMSVADGVRISGAAPNADAMHAYLAALSDVATLRNVTLTSEKVDAKKKTSAFEIEADLVQRYGGKP